MSGYLLNFYKHSPLRDDILNDPAKRNRFNNEFSRNIVWSTFDRLEIRKIERFINYRVSEDSEKKWVGERQYSMIYEIEDDDFGKRLTYENNPIESKCQFAFKKSNSAKDEMEKFRFFGVSVVDFTALAYDSFFSLKNPLLNVRRKLIEVLDDLCHKNNILHENICYDIYGSLGGNDAVIIWLSNQFEDLMLLVEALRCSFIKNKNIGIISNIYTILGVRDIDNPNVDYGDVKGEFNIRLTKRTGYNGEAFKSNLIEILNNDIICNANDLIKTVAGEHDICVTIPGNCFVSKLYTAEGIIHMNQEPYYKNFIQSNTEIAVKGDFKDIKTTIIDFECNKEEQYFVDDREIYILVDEICKTEMLRHTAYLGETLWILYSDYLKNITSTFSHPWTQDLHYQFKSCLECLKSITEEYKSSEINQDKYDAIEFVVENLRQIILHIAQANRIFFEVPNTQLKHTGTYSKILRSYQGIVKYLLKQAYLIPKINKQTEIIPFVSFDTIPIPESNSYCNDLCEKLLVEIKLPYDALVDIKHYTYLLAHEVFHYIAPADRVVRNEIIAIISICTIFHETLKAYISDLKTKLNLNVEDQGIFFDAFNNSIAEHTMHYIVTNLDNVLYACIKDFDSKLEYDKFVRRLNNEFFDLYKNMEAQKNIFLILTQYGYDTVLEKIEKKYEEKGERNKEKIECDIIEAKKLIQYINDLRANKDTDTFCKWILQNLGVEKIEKTVKAIQKALMETMPDYYMIQIMNMNSESYCKEILRSRNILSNSDESIEQQLRMALIYNYCFVEKDKRLVQLQDSEWENDLVKFIDELNLDNDNEKEYIWKSIDCSIRFIRMYDQFLDSYFSLLDFKKFEENDEFKYALDEFRKKIVINEQNDFKTNIKYIENLQIQQSLEELFDKKTINSGGSEKKRWECNTGYEKPAGIEDEGNVANDFYSLVKYLGDAAKKIVDNSSDEIWYRGHEDSSYKLIPTLYRMNNGKFYNTSLRKMMEMFYKSFKVKSFKMPEIFDSGSDTTIGTMSSMQHYSLPTNILDWTPSVLNAIYFAVEPFMLKKREVKPDSYADIWLLNPIRLNEIRKESQTATVDSNDNEIIFPIASIMNDEEEFSHFMPLTNCKEGEEDKIPIAVYAPYVNQRIKAQCGTFTMFSLDVPAKVVDDAKDFSNYDLHEIQVELKSKDETFKPFLNRVHISALAIDDIIKHLKLMGIQRHIIYPELENIAKDFREQVEEYVSSRFKK